MEHILEGYFILQDPMSAYYETLCTGLDWIEDFNMEGPVDNNQNNSGLSYLFSFVYVIIFLCLVEFEWLILFR